MNVRLLPAVLLAVTLSACSANPGPPPVEEAPETTTTSSATPTSTPAPSRSEQVIAIGIDPLPAGFNPHLQADASSFTRSLADLVLPSAFPGGVMDTNVLVSAAEIEAIAPAARTVRYVISPAAQWSDGTPLTGADFRYLWQGMTSTPGVLDAAGYDAITEVRTSADGRTVDVDFASPVPDWRELFNHLLPAHVFQGEIARFATALDDDIPASGGRYAVQSVDRSRGVVTLHRNDRFWGADPAATDRVSFHEIRSVTQGVEQLRTGQIGYLDATPGETAIDSYRLMRDTQVRLIDIPRELTLHLSVTSALLGEQEVRAELHSLIDVPLIARLASGRTAELNVPPHQPARSLDQGPPELLPALTEDRPLRIGVDPADETAVAAARTLTDLLSQFEVRAEMVTAELGEHAGARLPEGEVDMVLAWQRVDSTALQLAGRWQCPPSPEAPRSGNLSGYCSDDTRRVVEGLRSGIIPVDEGKGFFLGLNTGEHLTVPVLGERRMLVLGDGIVGPDPDLENWTAGISTVASWRTNDNP
ncbi:MAG: ABC transporter family substrate-binding protein [Corynebacterium sp.]|uniref:ABC transporter family substrate-binding protein n=1 Tax=Corynebacterium sp. TaxID=1720 RepID=UPI0026E07F37|nr:ABC transporter family substrate-binding protein [Corynebacterium sp.]MDO5668670.1 ABC transporter family substrate-binding protein [Corynebacterium sp.]